MKNYKWSRAARTDKGVHALVNGVACVFAVREEFWEERVEGKKEGGEGEGEGEGKEEAVEEIDPKRIRIVLKKEVVLEAFRKMFD